jgi:hypothetical protein
MFNYIKQMDPMKCANCPLILSKRSIFSYIGLGSDIALLRMLCFIWNQCRKARVNRLYLKERCKD